MADGDGQHGELNISHTVPSDVGTARLDKYLGDLEEVELSRSKAQKLIAKGLIRVDGHKVLAKHTLTGGEVIAMTIPPTPSETIKPENIPIEIVHEDDYLVVVNKPAGMVTHPGVGNRSGTLANALAYHFDSLSSEGGVFRPGIVHRLDKDTSGLLVVARDDNTHVALQELIKTRVLKRTYFALVCGHMKEETGEINAAIGRHPSKRTLMAVDGDDSREAVTHYRLIERCRSYDYLEIDLETGRTHQIRVHLSHLGHPVFGDADYGGRTKWVNAMFGPERPLARKMLEMLRRQALHAARLNFTHPSTGERLSFESPLPDDYASVLKLVKAEGAT